MKEIMLALRIDTLSLPLILFTEIETTKHTGCKTCSQQGVLCKCGGRKPNEQRFAIGLWLGQKIIA